MRATLKEASILAIPVLILGALIVGATVPGLYMVVIGGAHPGDAIYLDELAPSKSEAARQIAIGIVLIVAAMLTRAYARRKLHP